MHIRDPAVATAEASSGRSAFGSRQTLTTPFHPTRHALFQVKVVDHHRGIPRIQAPFKSQTYREVMAAIGT